MYINMVSSCFMSSYKPVRGAKDVVNCKVYNEVCSIFKEHMHLYGFDEIKFPILEHKHLYSSVGNDSDLVAKEMFTVASSSKSDDKNIVLRGEGTISCIRAAINAGIANQRKKLWYTGSMFRYSRPQKKRLREFTQLGCEHINANQSIYELEIIQCLVDFLRKIGISSTVHINSLCSKKTLNIYRQEVHKFFVDNQDQLLESSRSRLHSNILRLIDSLTLEEKTRLSEIPHILNYASSDEVESFKKILNFMQTNSIDYIHDPFLVRGLDYYTTTIFELFSSDNNAIAGGGRYETINCIKGIGWGLGLERIIDDVQIKLNKQNLYVVFALNQDYGLYIAGILRKNHFCTEIMIAKDFTDCIKKSSTLRPDFIVICDEEDAQKKQIRVRNWQSKEEEIVSIANIRDLLVI